MVTNEQPAEDFRCIPGWPGYEVSNQGRVRNATNFRLRSLMQDGRYKAVKLKSRTYRVHRLVMLAFVGEPPLGSSVDHIDRDPSNNFLENLRYATAKEQRRNQANSPSPNLARRVEGVSDNGVVVYDSMLAAAIAVGGGTGALWKAINWDRPYRGYRWRYIVEDNEDVWKEIPPLLIGGQTGYAASEGGLIRFPNGRSTAGSLNKGYLRVSINNTLFSVHRLIAGTYLRPAAAEQIIVNHQDGNKSNNKVENLEFVTLAENVRHAHRTGLVGSQGHRLMQCTLQGEFLREFRNAYEAGRSLSKSNKAIYACCRGKQKTAYGYIWKYSEKAQPESQV
jgi:hypothetical protein